MVRAVALQWVAAVLALAREVAATATCSTCAETEGPEESVLMQHRAQRHTYDYPCTAEVEAAQTAWKSLILNISAAYLADTASRDFVKIARAGIDELYAYKYCPVMFKPTQAAEKPFRPDYEGALSYFVGYAAISPRGFEEDKGFAIAGGAGWSKVRINNDQISCLDDVVQAQGYYYFTNAATKEEVAVEYSWVYKLIEGKWKIILHHSSIPYMPAL